ncbi:MAG: hypothetical protein FD180_2789 [Planctomycetota bacterium]|nr:MAG: hypothetical protein FD180_2789 [Planctomycetota bacterium]
MAAQTWRNPRQQAVARSVLMRARFYSIQGGFGVTQRPRRPTKLLEGANVFETSGKDRLMTCGAETKSESPCCCPGKCDYYEVARKIAFSGAQALVSEMVEVRGANAVEIDAQLLSLTGTYSIRVLFEFSDDGVNWTRAPSVPFILLSAPGAQSALVSGISGKFVRLAFLAGTTGSARMSAGVRLRTEPPILVKAEGPILPGLEAADPGADTDYFLLADRLFVALGTSVTLAPVSMTDRNALRLEIVVVQPAGLPISADVQGSNDTQTWETLSSFTGLAFGSNAPAAVTGISHRYVRAKINGPQALSNAIVELGMTLSRQSP